MNINIEKLLAPVRRRVEAYLYSLRDIRNVGISVFVVIVLLISWSGVKTIQTNYVLQRQITKLSQQNELQQLRNGNQKLQNEYLQTDQYLEVTARQNLGLAAPGETELLVPKAVAMAHTVALPKPASKQVKVASQSGAEHNFRAWMDFFFHRGSSD